MSNINVHGSGVMDSMSKVKGQRSHVSWVFFGTDSFATTILDELKQAGFYPTLIVTAPDRPQGRKLVITPPPAKIWAQENNIEILQPETFDTDVISQLSQVKCQLFLVASYGNIIPQEVLEIPPHKTLNVHPSLLPKLRGASPVQTALLQEDKTGVSIMRIDDKMDHGPIVAQKETHQWDLSSLPEADSLEKELASAGGKLLAESIGPWVAGKLPEVPQDHTQASFTKKIKKTDAEIQLSDPAEKNIRKIKAYAGWPRAFFFTTIKGQQKRIVITKATYSENALYIQRVIPEGEKEMSFEDFQKKYVLLK